MISEYVIDSFRDKYSFLSNFYFCKINYNGRWYGSSEAAYQASKCDDESDKCYFTDMTPMESKKMGRKVKVIDNWNIIKYQIMYEILKEKFKDILLQEKLLDTYPTTLMEGNHWHDNDWGICQCEKCKETVFGENNLGKLLTLVREECLTEKQYKIGMIKNLYGIILNKNLSSDNITDIYNHQLNILKDKNVRKKLYEL